MNHTKTMRSTRVNAAPEIKVQTGTGQAPPKPKEVAAKANCATPVEELQLLLYATGFYDAAVDREIETMGRILSDRRVSCSEHT
jgi:hypothetical protein